ncbi:MAG: hypothetical protein ACXVPD_05020 [Bacteroidia bacterium]
MSDSITTPPVRIKVSKYVKNLFFKGLQAQKSFKELKKVAGDVTMVSIIIMSGKSILRSKTESGNVDSPMTDGEISRLLKGLSIKKDKLKDKKYIFVGLNMKDHTVTYKEEMLSGEINSFIV